MIQMNPRRAFTLVELLVVISIITVIGAISVGAYFRIQAQQTSDFTEVTVTKIDQTLQRKVQLIRDQIDDDAKNMRPGSGYPELLKNNYEPDVAKAILLYCRTKNQLPMSFTEATTPVPVPGTLNVVTGISVILQPQAVFRGLTGGTGDVAESSVCLFLALAPMGIEGFEQQIGDSAIPGYKCYLDGYRKPLIFNRLAYDGDNGELNAPPFTNPATPFDPFYPKKLGAVYRPLTDYPGMAALWNLVRTNVPAWAGPLPAIYPGLKYHTTCVISSNGKNHYNESNQAGPGGIYGGGNIVSYRLRQEGNKGD